MKKNVYLILVLFIISNTFAQISNNPHTFENHGNNVGIFTHHPHEALEVAEGNVKITYGRLYLGKVFTAPNYYKLLLNGGNIAIKDTLPNLTFNLNEPGRWPRFANFAMSGFNGAFSPHAIKGDMVIRLGGTDQNKMILTNSGGGDIVFATDSWEDNSIKMSIKPSGNVGIGTRNPDESLTVKGKIHCEEVKVDLNIPADYVFQQYFDGQSELKPQYKFLKLEEVEEYVKQNKHLPEMPSAEEIKKNGLALKETTNLLLQKIEELTLYTIELNNKIKDLEDKLQEAKTQLIKYERKSNEKIKQSCKTNKNVKR